MNLLSHNLDLDIESLESRLMLAGNVDVVVRGDNIVVKGDSDANEISLAISGGELQVTGLNGTTVNGGDTDAVTVGNLSINLRGGDDVISIVGVSIDGKLKIVSGSGNDDVTLSQLTVGGNASLVTGGDNDQANIDSTTFNGRSTVKMGGGDDVLRIAQSIDIADTVANDKVNISLGGGNDELRVDIGAVIGSNAVLNSAAVLNGGGGIDSLFVNGSPVDPDMLELPENISVKSFESPE